MNLAIPSVSIGKEQTQIAFSQPSEIVPAHVLPRLPLGSFAKSSFSP